MRHFPNTLIGLFALAGIALSPMAAAAPTPAQKPAEGHGTMGDGHGMMEHHKHHHGDPAAFMEKRLTDLKADLKITPQQEPAWNAYADAVRQGFAQAKPNREATEKATTAPERLDRHIDMMKQRVAAMEKARDAFKPLYQQLTPEQKTIADQRAFRMDHGPMGGKNPGPRGERQPKAKKAE